MAEVWIGLFDDRAKTAPVGSPSAHSTEPSGAVTTTVPRWTLPGKREPAEMLDLPPDGIVQGVGARIPPISVQVERIHSGPGARHLEQGVGDRDRGPAARRFCGRDRKGRLGHGSGGRVGVGRIHCRRSTLP